VAGSTAEPAALTAASAPTVMPEGSTVLAVPIPPFMAPITAPVPAPTLPCATGAPGGVAAAASTASRPSAASGRARQRPPRPRSNSTAAGTTGTTCAGSFPTRTPRPCSSSQLIAPAAESSPKALPPVSTIACTRSTTLRGSSASVSRVPGAPPRESTPATAPSAGGSTTVVPVSQPGLSSPTRCAWPTRRPGTSVRAS
jgi:hypothetical protein